MTITIQTITIPVADQDRALAFYREALGFETRADDAWGEQRWLTVAPAGDGAEFVLHRPLPGLTAGSMTGVVLATDDLDAASGRLRAAGAEVEGPEQVGWGRQAQFADPDGNRFVLVERASA